MSICTPEKRYLVRESALRGLVDSGKHHNLTTDQILSIFRASLNSGDDELRHLLTLAAIRAKNEPGKTSRTIATELLDYIHAPFDVPEKDNAV